NIQLHEEKLDIAKKWIQTGEVNIHEEVLTEEKNITVPVNRKELVIEKKGSDGNSEAIRIPISEERVEIIKHPIVLENVEVFKHQYQDIKSIEETLKKEKLHVETTGDAAVTYNGSEKHL
ncbi:MAG: YsnF/AvaK domain-containing protein, partial [Clostridiaceae bacterium]|nr:YsnF/AvaK domain-containing protein [Clostridiaceae bacterium]